MGKGRTRGTKKGWKQIEDHGADVLEEMHVEREMASKPDSEFFFHDPNPMEETIAMKLTRRQRAAMEHRKRMELMGDEDIEMKEDDDIKRENGKKGIMMKMRVVKEEEESKKSVKRKKINQNQQAKQPYDLWEDEGQQQLPKKKKRPQYVPSALPAVILPPEGASYNPPMNSYLKMIGQIAKEEQQIEAQERRTERRIGLNGPVELIPEMREEVPYFSLKNLGNEREANEEEMAIDDKRTEDDLNHQSVKPKTMREKKRKKARRMEEKRAEMEKKLRGNKQQQLQSLKSLNREVINDLEEHQKKILEKRRIKAMKALTQRKRLGRGKFEPYEEPLLTMEELPSNLRQLSAQGNIFQERLKSLQQRNILPIAGERAQPKLKARLKAKYVEKRSAKEVTQESRQQTSTKYSRQQITNDAGDRRERWKKHSKYTPYKNWDIDHDNYERRPAGTSY